MRYFAICMAMLFVVLTANAQTMNIHKKDGEVVNYSISTVDYVDFTPVYKECPDENHPHMIDLGLPSGTKWACCNVGATSPEDYGGYYAWGETEEKDVYNWNSYKYYVDANEDGHAQNNEVAYLGANIAGTDYDVAHVKWGGLWHMPTKGQFEELVNSCTRSDGLVEKNGIKGYEVTGSNGGSIFLPAVGWRFFSDQYNDGAVGIYWSSSQFPITNFPDGIFCAYTLSFYVASWDASYGVDNTSRDYGHAVRPVIE